jgi:hypothetical protein
MGGRTCTKVEYSFREGHGPDGFAEYRPVWGNKVGVTSYHGYFTEAELQDY